MDAKNVDAGDVELSTIPPKIEGFVFRSFGDGNEMESPGLWICSTRHLRPKNTTRGVCSIRRKNIRYDAFKVPEVL
jgi:hypothetical protein